MRKKIKSWNPEEKERVIEDVKRLGVVAGCRKHGIYATTYYKWLDRYEANGIEGLKDRRGLSNEAILKKKDKEIRLLKEVVVEKELIIKMQQELIKKKLNR